MNGQIISPDNIATTPPKWQHPILPAPATQGNILITTTPFDTPPEDSSNFKWLPMEKIIGTADVKMEYDEVKNEFNFYKAAGHLDNNGVWHYDWEKFATVVGISEETQRELQNLIYVSYIYDTAIANTLKVYGVKKNGELQLLCNISFVSSQEFAVAINNLSERITNEVNRATNRETQIENNLNSEISRATTQENNIRQQLNNEISRATTSEHALQDQIDDVRENLAEYIGNFDTKAALDAYSGSVSNNDYAIVLDDETHDHQCWRYIYKESTHSWRPQYMVNEEPMTQAQVRAINSGIDTTKVAQIETNRQNILTKQNQLTPSNGINLVNDVISAKVNTNQGIRVDNNGTGVKLDTDRLQFDISGNVTTKIPNNITTSVKVDTREITEFTAQEAITKNTTYTIKKEDIVNSRFLVAKFFAVVTAQTELRKIERVQYILYINGIEINGVLNNFPPSATAYPEEITHSFNIPTNSLKVGDEIKCYQSVRTLSDCSLNYGAIILV